MVSKRWRKVEELYHAAQQRRPAERSAFLAQSCGGDKQLKHEIELLLAQDSGGKILDGPAAVALESDSGEFDSPGFHAAAKRRIPWWMALIGVSYLALYGFGLYFWYLIFWGPAELPGFVATFSGNAMVIQSVDADSQVQREECVQATEF